MSLGDDNTLQQDGDLFEPLSRVAYQPGMMLGVEAVRDEQAYNRRRLNRHRYWLHGAGTVVGLAVTVDHQAANADPDRDQAIELRVSPGIAIDGLGREVVVDEPYCLDLRAWIEAHRDADSREWNGSSVHIPQQGGLWLDISIRQQDCDHGLQPVIAHQVNATIDPVATSRVEEGLHLEIEPITPEDADPASLSTPVEPGQPLPGAMHPGSPPDLDALLTETEKDYLGNLAGVQSEFARINADRLYRLRESSLDGDTGASVSATLQRLAQVPLARIRLATLNQTRLVSHPSRIAINNLLRPFVTNPDVLRWVLQTHA